MDDFDQLISWHPRYRAKSLFADQRVLLGETASYLLTSEQHSHLLAHLHGPTSLAVLLEYLPNPLEQAKLIHTVDHFLNKGILHIHGEAHDVSTYHLPNFTLAPFTTTLNSGVVELHILSQFDDLNLLTRWIKLLDIHHPMSIVIVDDYLDPRLKLINQSHLLRKRAWLIIKPSGDQALIGPYFNFQQLPKQHPQTPCWQCLATALWYNQPVRKWLQQRNPAGTHAVPIRYAQVEIEACLALAIPRAQQYIDQQISQRLSVIDHHQRRLQEHPVNYLPHCIQCGDAQMFSRHNRKIVVIQSCPKRYTSDGGARSLSPEETLDNLRSFISPLTGIVADLTILSNTQKQDVPIYRTTFFKTPCNLTRFNDDAFTQVSLGKGITAAQSQASALCESLERYAAQYQGNESWELGVATHLDAEAILPQQLCQFSDRQYRHFRDPGHPDYFSRHAVQKYPAMTALHWASGWSLTNDNVCYLPFTYCYANTPFVEEQFCRWDSNGCAAGNTLEEGILQGFFELIERDACAIWWYNEIQCPQVDLKLVPQAHLRRIQQSLDPHWSYWLLDLTHDFEIPVIAAIGQHKKTKKFSFGFGCHFSAMLACQRALTELCQIISIREQHAAPFDFNLIKPAAYLFPDNIIVKKPISENITEAYADIRKDISTCVELTKKRGMEIVIVDYSRPGLPIHTVKVVVPGLCHIWPQFGNQRLYDVPVDMHWHSQKRHEKSLNPLNLYI